MGSENQNGAQSLAKKGNLEPGPFVLRPLLQDVPLSADGDQEDVKINCVDYLDGNLYVGTSASELLHFVQVPPDPADKGADPVLILASKLRPAFSEALSVMNGSRPGVQQILLLPRVNKACVLCNFTVTFYSLPEMSPAFGAIQVKNCNWIGGVDLNEGPSNNASTGVTILMSLTRRIQLVRIGEDAPPRVVKKIDFAGSTLSVRRDSIACVADSRSYALLEVDQQLKIPLMSISSLDDSQPGGTIGQAQNIASRPDDGLLRSASSAQSRPLLTPQDAHSHTRSTSLGNFITGNARKGHEKRHSEVDQSIFQQPDSPTPSRSSSRPTTDKPLPIPPNDSTSTLLAAQAGQTTSGRTPSPGVTPRRTASPATAPAFLKPHIVSPTPEEFLLVTGTGPLDPGIGMFVNLDGDPTRPTVEFERYPREIVVDGGSQDTPSPNGSMGEEIPDGYVLASMAKDFEGDLHHGLEIQRFDLNVGEDEATKHWLEAKDSSSPLGVRSLLSSDDMHFQDVADKLCRKRFSPFAPGRLVENSAVSLKSVDSRTALSIERVTKEKELLENGSESDEDLPDRWEEVRNREEQDFVARFAKTTSRLAVWTGNTIWWAVRNPLLLQLEAGLQAAGMEGSEVTETELREQRTQFVKLLTSIRGRDPKTELEFMTFSYTRQRAGVMLLASFLRLDGPRFSDSDLRAMEEVLLEGGLDPRVVLAMIPPIRNEIVESRRGIWIYGGVKAAVEDYIASESGRTVQPLSSLRPEVIEFMGRFLTAYRRQKGFGSIADEKDVFKTVDAALLVVLLELDQGTKGAAAKPGSVRQMLYELVDHGVDCWDRAVDLLESYHRLFVLSRLYQSRKMASDVLATWRRIIEGERDDGNGELGDGEQKVRNYLKNVSSQSLVQEYGIWLANRNPKLGVQVLADDKGRAPKFEPTQVVTLLREEAPEAVKYYLEHLVFGKGHTTYVNELISYYLDIVINNLHSSPSAREIVMASYDTYRALRPPKATYRQFLQDNTPPDNEEVWHSRLRLLQLLGGAHDYDSKSIQSRITTSFPEDNLLVPEAIILHGRERSHEKALRLLVHHLGDYDTAVSYCLRGGSSIYIPPQGRKDSLPSQDTQTQLFRYLLKEFMDIPDQEDRIEQTGALLSRFGGWFDVMEVLELVPDEWSVDVATEFLVTTLRNLVRERHEGMLERALSATLNLRVNWEAVEMRRVKGAVVDLGDGGLAE